MDRMVAGALAGAIGTGALELTAPLERVIAGGPVPFAPTAIAHRLVGGDDRAARLVGRALRYTYGPALAILYARVRPRRRPLLTLAGAVLGFELVALPLVFGTRLFRPRVLVALALHVATFAAVTVRVERRLG
jgi:hypothetical protein